MVAMSQKIAEWHGELDLHHDPLMRKLAEVNQQKDETFDSMDQRVRESEETFERFGNVVDKAMGFVGAILKLTGAVAAASAPLATAVVAAEKADTRLARSLKIVGDEGGETQQLVGGLADELSRLIVVSENQVKATATLGTTFGLTGKELEQATASAIGLSEKFEHMGLTRERAMRLVGRASQGDFAGLKRLGIQVDDLSTGQEKFNRLLEIGRDGLRDGADRADTAAGGLKRLWNSAQGLATSVGKLVGFTGKGSGFLEYLIGGVDTLTDKVDAIFEKTGSIKDRMIEFLGIDMMQFSTDTIIATLENVADAALVNIETLFLRMKKLAQDLLNDISDMIPGSDEAIVKAGAAPREAFASALNMAGLLSDEQFVAYIRDSSSRTNTALRRVRAGGSPFDVGDIDQQIEEMMRDLDSRMARRLRDAEARSNRPEDPSRDDKINDLIDRLNFTSDRGGSDDVQATVATVSTALGQLRIPGQDTIEAMAKERNRLLKKIEEGLRNRGGVVKGVV